MNEQAIYAKLNAGQPLTEEEKAFLEKNQGSHFSPAVEPKADGGVLQSAAAAQKVANDTGLQKKADIAVQQKLAEDKMRAEEALKNKKSNPNGSVLESTVDAIEKAQEPVDGGSSLNDIVADKTGLDKSEIENISLGDDGFQLGKTVEIAAEESKPEKGDTEEEKEAKKKYKASTRSIWSAYNAGEIDKETAGYFTIDAIATLAKNLGRSIGNVGAQFSGGTIDQGHDTSAWEDRQNQLRQEEIQMEKEELGGKASREAEAQTLANQRAAIINQYTPEQLRNQMDLLRKQVEAAGINIDIAGSKKETLDWVQNNMEDGLLKAYIVSLLAQQGVDSPAQIMQSVAGLIPGV